jgi:hypothetical protein
MHDAPIPVLWRDKPARRGKLDSTAPLGGNAMEIRVAKLEEAIPEIRQSLARIESTLTSFDKHVFPHLVSKADLGNEVAATGLAVANLRTEITRMEGSMIKWFIGTTMLLVGGFGAIASGLARVLN